MDSNTASRYQELVLKGEVESVRKHEIPVDMALVGDKDYPIKGATDFVSNQVDPNTGSLRLRAVFPNENGSLSAGQFGRIPCCADQQRRTRHSWSPTRPSAPARDNGSSWW